MNFYAKRSNAAYDSIDEIRTAYPLTTRATTVQSADVRYFIEFDKVNRKQTLSIRGTAERQNVWEDIETSLVPDSALGISLHRGFKDGATAIFKDARPYLQKDYPIRITGHSLGGAIAAILGMYLQKEGFEVERVVTFGQPRISSEQPQLSVLENGIRVVHNNDIVPMVPPGTKTAAYQHFSAEIILREGSNYVFLRRHDATRLSVGDFWRSIKHLSLDDHQMAGYLQNIQYKVKNGANQIPYFGTRQRTKTGS